MTSGEIPSCLTVLCWFLVIRRTEVSLLETSSIMAGVYFLKIRGLLPVLTVLFICLTQTIYSAPLSSYLVSRFTSPDPTLPFNHITINNITGEVYIGARQRLYQLNSDLTLKHTVDTGQCPSPNGNTNNNKLLLVAPSPEDKLITCGSCDGYCETRSLTNISHDVVRYETSSGQLVVTVTSDAPTVGAVVLGADYVPNGESTLDDGLYLFTGISDVTLSFPSVSKYSFVDLSTVQNVLPPQTLIPQNINHLIAYMEYLYYFISRGDSVYLGRLCRNSLDLRFASYTEIELQCESDNVIQSAHIGPAGSQLGDSLNIESTDDLLYAIFTSGSSSALCFYKMSDVQQRFEDAVLGCIQGDNNELGTTNDYFGDYSFCKSFPDTYTLPDTAQCTAYFRDGDEPPATQYQYASGTVPLSASPIITIPDVTCTSIVTTIERQHTVAFMGDTQGNIHKVNIVNSSYGYVYETVPVGSGSVLQDTFLDESSEQITLATSSDQGSQEVQSAQDMRHAPNVMSQLDGYHTMPYSVYPSQLSSQTVCLIIRHNKK
ncbi:plexin-A4-like [Strongylocentrotus purpuratus]|uniref:Sema domain-containing protein n=1 Tax=Strongylocentrotus purpuratus TaxID=7668 RepID=A0A7M7MZH6_STRPU|nr:plexin-A4-like [Strongylocentrotus purpuratus]